MSAERVSTGVGALEDVLERGLNAERTYMRRDPPGTGKTVLGLQFLIGTPELVENGT
ncbi:MAG: ATPase domain-containing protein [Halolamina sp.]|uniref:ATPase domain-containing protein n=1 Tax=Halolamina sp. TaxID=1940283 RepID=UPI002FC295CA